jgi:hypothetical protein
MKVAIQSAALGAAGLGTGAAAALVIRRARRRKPSRAVVTVDLAAAPGERGIEMRLESFDLSKERLKAFLRDLKAEIEAGEVATGERSR